MVVIKLSDNYASVVQLEKNYSCEHFCYICSYYFKPHKLTYQSNIVIQKGRSSKGTEHISTSVNFHHQCYSDRERLFA